MNILVVKTYFENDEKDAEKYLEFNNYGSVKNIQGTDLYLCLLGEEKPNELNDVRVVDKYMVNGKLEK